MADEHPHRHGPNGRELAFGGGWLVGVGSGLAGFAILIRFYVHQFIGIPAILGIAFVFIAAGLAVAHASRRP